MAFWEAILAFDIAIQAERDALEVLAPTSLTTRVGYGKPKITHAAAFVSTNDVERVELVPSGMNDAAGIPIPCVNLYGNVNNWSLKNSKLAIDVEVPENCLITPYATSETAADTVVFVWAILEYPNGGTYQRIGGGAGMTKRNWEAGAALGSNVAANSTDINDLLAGHKYQVSGVSNVGINGATAGCVGPAFIKFRNPEFFGSECWLPLINNNAYVVGNGQSGNNDFLAAEIKMPVVAGGTPFRTACIGYTAEQPQGQICFVVDKLFS